MYIFKGSVLGSICRELYRALVGVTLKFYRLASIATLPRLRWPARRTHSHRGRRRSGSEKVAYSLPKR